MTPGSGAGGHADTVLLLVRDTIYLPDINKRLLAGDMLGEVAIFSDHATRSTTAVCEDECELLRIKGEKVLELFYQDKTNDRIRPLPVGVSAAVACHG
ncbi:MAG: hypothetical protein CFE43_07645 [Burkholderiales bacterium PBB3]|nr:MAG: hypothetical protein CFE43_07645 [Burkholderiales bacterium PBB3]